MLSCMQWYNALRAGLLLARTTLAVASVAVIARLAIGIALSSTIAEVVVAGLGTPLSPALWGLVCFLQLNYKKCNSRWHSSTSLQLACLKS